MENCCLPQCGGQRSRGTLQGDGVSPDGVFNEKLLLSGVNPTPLGCRMIDRVLGAKPPESMIMAGSSEGGRERLGLNQIGFAKQNFLHLADQLGVTGLGATQGRVFCTVSALSCRSRLCENVVVSLFHQRNGADIHAVSLQSRLEEIEADDVELILPVIQMGHGDAEGVVLSVTDQA